MSRWPGLNWRPTPYHGVALPLSYIGILRASQPSLYPPPIFEPPRGVEPRTSTLQKYCSAIELGWHNNGWGTIELLWRKNYLTLTLPILQASFLARFLQNDRAPALKAQLNIRQQNFSNQQDEARPIYKIFPILQNF